MFVELMVGCGESLGVQAQVAFARYGTDTLLDDVHLRRGLL